MRDGFAALERHGHAELMVDAVARLEAAPGRIAVLPARIVGVDADRAQRLGMHGRGGEVEFGAVDRVPVGAHRRQVVADADRGDEAARMPDVDRAVVRRHQGDEALEQLQRELLAGGRARQAQQGERRGVRIGEREQGPGRHRAGLVVTRSGAGYHIGW
ncbi:hypothetical protein M2165_001450 [Variovorax sp. TBS-050B]|uniref:hypothetical protein n=1 Tax=Variovorax sp. TBS-050B TaxID=2940551 RepID=UPI0024735F1D|nr:hypothetical protein [Variovorax sp. TBS-050B]MDH6591561.1 hypothetical protein [Variovorax sp. TBS-050B]